MAESASAVSRQVLHQEGFFPEESSGLFVGISVFEDETFVPVRYAVDDAVDLAWVFALELGLIDPSQCVLALAGEPVKEESILRLSRLVEGGARVEQPRKREILRLSMEQSQSGEGRGLFVLSVATHGLSEGGVDFVIASDSLRDDLLDTGVSVSRLFEKAANAQAQRRLLLLDACREIVHQGQRSISEPTMSQGFAEAISEARGLTVLSGSTVGGYSYDDLVRKNGVFTGSVVRGLLGDAKSDARGFITVETLANYVQEQVVTWVRKNRPRHSRVSRGIERRFDEEAEKMPLAVDPRRAREPASFENLRKAAIKKLRENIGDSERAIITGELFGEISRYFRLEHKPAAADHLLAAMAKLDGDELAQRAVRDIWREIQATSVLRSPSASPKVSVPSIEESALLPPLALPSARVQAQTSVLDSAADSTPTQLFSIPELLRSVQAEAALELVQGPADFSSVFSLSSFGQEPDLEESQTPPSLPVSIAALAPGPPAPSPTSVPSLSELPTESVWTPLRPAVVDAEDEADLDFAETSPKSLSWKLSLIVTFAILLTFAIYHFIPGSSQTAEDSTGPTTKGEVEPKASPKKSPVGRKSIGVVPLPVSNSSENAIVPALSSEATIPQPTQPEDPKPGEVYTDGFGLRFHWVPGGTFTIGSPDSDPDKSLAEDLAHPISIQGFWLAETEVTQEFWIEQGFSNPSKFRDCAQCPVESVTWYDAIALSERLSAQAGLAGCNLLSSCKGDPGVNFTCTSTPKLSSKCQGYRLPTEAEWEVAARAQAAGEIAKPRYGEVANIAIYGGNSKARSAPVGGNRLPNAWGFLDMLGNVEEWVWDSRGNSRAVRGGHWSSNASEIRAAYWHRGQPQSRDSVRGFRLALAKK